MSIGRIVIILIHNDNQNLAQDVNKGEEEKEKIEQKCTNLFIPKEYINPDLEDATNNMLEEYIEKAYKINELVVEMEPFYSNRRPIPTQ